MNQAHRPWPTFHWILLAGACCAAAASASGQTVTVDNGDAGFTILYGEWSTGTYGVPYGDNYNWALTTAAGGEPAAVEWRPNLPEAGEYQVAIWYVAGGNRAENAVFTVEHADGATPIVVDQRIDGQTWRVLGTFSFDGGSGGSVMLHNDADPSVVIADAVRFARVSTTAELTMAAEPGDGGTTDPAPGETYTHWIDEVVEISAEPYAGYEFYRWTVSAGSPAANPWSPSTTVLVDQDKTVTAVFVEEGVMDGEFRGFWADAFHVGFKSQSDIDDMISRALAGHYNAIVPEILAYQDTGGSGHGAYWDSAIIPRASDISGSFDPLAYLVAEAHAAGLEVHPWLVAFRVCTSWPPSGNSIVSAHPEWIMVPRGSMDGGPAHVDGKFTLDPGSPDVQEYLLSIVREVANNYAIDGIHWDYIRYTSTDAGYPAHDWYTRSGLARFQEITGYTGTPSIDYGPWNDFRRREITELIRRAEVEVATADNPRQPLRHSAALITWGDAPSDFTSTNSWRLFQNWREWMEQGYLDAGIPMTYYDYDTYPTWFEHWVDQELVWRYDRHIFVGPGIYLNDFADSVYEITYAQNAGADGICTYSYAVTSDSGSDWSWYPHAASTVFAQALPTPAMPWRDPVTATRGSIYGRVTNGATGEPIDDATIEVSGFPVVQTDGNGFFVVTELLAGSAGTAVPLSATYPGYTEVVRPAVLVERAGFTEANLALGTWLPGDYDVDGDVDIDDFTQFVSGLTGPDNGPPPAGTDLFDFNQDNDVDLIDFASFQASFGQ